MKTLSMVLLAILSINTIGAANASQQTVDFVAQDNSAESNLCVVAGKNGYSAAVEAAKNLNVDAVFALTCNGESIKSFAASYEIKAEEEIIVKTIKVVPANENAESKVCALAVQKGLSAVEGDTSGIVCNGLRINRFVSKYASL